MAVPSTDELLDALYLGREHNVWSLPPSGERLRCLVRLAAWEDARRRAGGPSQAGTR